MSRNDLAATPLGHVPALDGLRGVAIGMVVLVHLYAPIFSGGSSGVDVFFVLSGFLITKLALEEHDRSGALSLRDFYLRRVFRILPALFVLLAALLVASWWFLSDVGADLRAEIALSADSMGNLWPLFRGFDPRGALGHTWSLGLEEQFYLVWPLVLAAVPFAMKQPRRLARVTAAVAVASIVIGRVVVLGLADYPHWESLPFFNLDGLALGCVIALALHSAPSQQAARPRKSFPVWPALLAAGLVLFDLFAARAYIDHDTYRVRIVVLRLCFGCILLTIMKQPSLGDRWRLTSKPMMGLGRLSYSLYLWHVPVFYVLSNERHPDVSRTVLAPARLVVAIVAAILSYRFVEQPMIRLGRKMRERRRAAAVALPSGAMS